MNHFWSNFWSLILAAIGGSLISSGLHFIVSKLYTKISPEELEREISVIYKELEEMKDRLDSTLSRAEAAERFGRQADRLDRQDETIKELKAELRALFHKLDRQHEQVIKALHDLRQG